MFRLYPERNRRARLTLPAKSVPVPSSSHLCALCVSAFSSPDVDAVDAASSVSPLSATLTKNTRGRVSLPIVNPIFQLNRRFVSNSHRIIFFAHPHPLTPIESYSCKKQGGGGAHPDRFATSLLHCLITSAPTRRNPSNSNPFMGLLHNSQTPRGRESYLQKKRSNFLATSTEHGTGAQVTEFWPRNLGHGTRVAEHGSLLLALTTRYSLRTP
jgi:hypothetical protein